MPRAPRVLPIAFTAALLLAVAGCGSESGDTSAGATSTGGDGQELVVYSGRNEQLVKPVLDDFTAKTGIRTSVRYGGTAELAAQLMEEGDRSDADVFFAQDAGALGAVANRGMLAALPQQQLDRVDPKFRSDDGRWVGVSGRARVIVHDPAQVPAEQVPGDVFDLTDPTWKGKVGIAPTNASFQAFVTAMRVLEGEERTKAWLQGMRANDVKIYDNNVAILDAVNNGELAMGLINHYYWYEKVAEQGADAVKARLKFAQGGDVGSLVNVAGAGVLTTTDQAESAQRLIEFLLSPEAQRHFAEQTKEYPLIDGVPTAADLPPLDSLKSPAIDLSDLATLDRTLQLLQEAGLS